MIPALQYEELKQDAKNALASLYGSFLKRIDRAGEKSGEQWANEWKQYREGEDLELQNIIEKMPEWMQYTFGHFASLQQFSSEIERAFIHHGKELTEAYKMGMNDAGNEPKKKGTDHEWRLPFKNYQLMLKTEKYRHISQVCQELKSTINHPFNEKREST